LVYFVQFRFGVSFIATIDKESWPVSLCVFRAQNFNGVCTPLGRLYPDDER
jgi:hypothetical protein